LVACSAEDPDEAFAREHREMTEKLRRKHGIPAAAGGADDAMARAQHLRRQMTNGENDDFPDMAHRMPGGAHKPRRPRMPRHPRMPRDGQGMDHNHLSDHEGADPYEGLDDPAHDIDHNIGKTKELTFHEASLGMEISREWGHSHFLIDKVKGEAAKLAVEVGHAVVAVNGAKTRWKNLAQLTEQIKKAGRPVTLTIGEHHPHGFPGRSDL